MLVNKTYIEEEEHDGKIVEVRKIVPEEIYKELYNHFNNNGKAELSEEAKRLESLVCHEAAKDIVKDYRYTYDKFFIHLPMVINFKAGDSNSLNDMILQYISGQNDMHIIGIDRGERNLIYGSVIDVHGNIVKQKAFNIVGGYDYQEKLKMQEGARQNARKEKNFKRLSNGHYNIRY